jgi:hypothetical protein
LGLTILPVDAIPTACKSLAKEADGPALNRALSARISLANCLADAKLKPIALCDCEQSVHEVEAATDLPVLLLDEVHALGDASMKILARQAKGDLLAGFVQRMVATVPPPVNASPEAAQLRQTRLDLLQPLLDPWQAQAQACFKEVDTIARANPQLAKNPAVTAAVRSSRAKLSALGVARR